MPITTTFSSENYISTSLAIFKEWVGDYISFDEIDYTDNDCPFFDENYVLQKPLIYLQMMPGTNNKPVGIGHVINTTQKGRKQNMEFMLYIFVDNNVGGADRCRQIAEKLQWNMMTNGYLLGHAGLKVPQLSSLREYPPDNYSKVFGGRMLLTFKTLLSYDD